MTAWLGQRCSAGVRTDAAFANLRWDVKPQILLWALDLGYDRVIWMDSDIIVTGDFRERLPRDPWIMIAAEEHYFSEGQGSPIRTTGWGLTPGRALPITVNSGIVGVTSQHRSVLEAWKALLSRADYRRAQEPGIRQPLHLISDQDALTALLGSTEFANVPLHLLRRGHDIAQCLGPSGFTPAERVRSLGWGLPPLVHAMGIKPWDHGAAWRHSGPALRRLRAAYDDLHIRLSPYTIVARELAGAAGVSAEPYESRGHIERALLAAGRRWPQLPELPLAVLDSLVRWVKARLKLGRRSLTFVD